MGGLTEGGVVPLITNSRSRYSGDKLILTRVPRKMSTQSTGRSVVLRIPHDEITQIVQRQVSGVVTASRPGDLVLKPVWQEW